MDCKGNTFVYYYKTISFFLFKNIFFFIPLKEKSTRTVVQSIYMTVSFGTLITSNERKIYPLAYKK
jgi:hypothetical protein